MTALSSWFPIQISLTGFRDAKIRYPVDQPPVPSSSLIHQATVTLTDAQIKALPTQAQTLVAAQGVTKVVIPTYLILRLNATGASAGYGNINENAVLLCNGAPHIAEIVNDSAKSVTALSDFLADFGRVNYGQLMPTFNVYAFNTSNQYTDLNIEIENVPFEIYVDNIGSGNFDGGDASNTLMITAVYMLYDTVTGAFE